MAVQMVWADRNLARLAKQFDQLNTRFPKVLPRIVNQVGNRAKTQVIRTLTKQTGLPRKTIVAAVGDPMVARPGRLSYTMVTRGGQIRLKYLSPRETRRGVVAKPFGQRTLFPGTFMLGGAFPGRKPVARFDGHVYERWGARFKISQVRSNVVIPQEMSRGATLKAFNQIAGPLLQQRVDAAIAKLLK